MKRRLDAFLVERGLVSGRDRAKGVIMAGQVYVDNQKADKPGMEISDSAKVEVRGESLRYVSRGGLKLERAMEAFAIRMEGVVCIDIGASTGGFTDCMLQNGAALVYAIDVGYGQLAWKLRNDERVVVLERTNIRHVTREQVPREAGFISIDVSFISLSLVLPVARELLCEGGGLVCLIKPQFEAGRNKVGKKGVVRDPQVHREVVERVVETAKGIGFTPAGLVHSPIKGPEGNIEYLLYLRKGGDEPDLPLDEKQIHDVVRESHEKLQVLP